MNKVFALLAFSLFLVAREGVAEYEDVGAVPNLRYQQVANSSYCTYRIKLKAEYPANTWFQFDVTNSLNFGHSMPNPAGPSVYLTAPISLDFWPHVRGYSEYAPYGIVGPELRLILDSNQYTTKVPTSSLFVRYVDPKDLLSGSPFGQLSVKVIRAELFTLQRDCERGRRGR